MTSSAQLAYRFNGFRVDPVRRLLFGADGEPIPLKPKVFDTLLYLVERPGELVDKQALLEAVWPHVVVEENNLNKAISTLRHVFGETRDEHRFIVTEPGRGYRFVASVEAVPTVTTSRLRCGPSPLSRPSGWRRAGRVSDERRRPVARRCIERDAGRRLRPSSSPRAAYFVTAAVAGGLGAALVWFLSRDTDARWLQEELVPQIEAHLDTGNWEAAYALAQEAEARVPDDPELLELWPRLSWLVTIESEPPGAAVYRRAYKGTDADWQELGRTPLRDIRIPFGLSRLRLNLDGYAPMLRTLGGGVLVGTACCLTVTDLLYRARDLQARPNGRGARRQGTRVGLRSGDRRRERAIARLLSRSLRSHECAVQGVRRRGRLSTTAALGAQWSAMGRSCRGTKR